MESANIELKDWRIENGLGGVPAALSGGGTIQVGREGDCVVIECETPLGQVIALVIEFDAGHARIRVHPPSEQAPSVVHDEAVISLVTIPGGVTVGNGHSPIGMLYRGENRIERSMCFNGEQFIREFVSAEAQRADNQSMCAKGIIHD